MTESNINTLIGKALKQKNAPEVNCEIQSIVQIRDEDPYGGYRVNILCRLENIHQIVSLDIAAGDPITPREIQYEFNPLYPGNPIQMASYNIESILAEKIETVYRRGLVNSRCKDFYDIHVLWTGKRELIDCEILRKAFGSTCAHRNTIVNKNKFFSLLDLLTADDQMVTRWRAYVKRNSYAREIEFKDTLDTLITIIPFLFDC